MNPRLSARLMRASIEVATPPSRSRRSSRRDRALLMRVAVMCVIALAYFGSRMA